MRKFISSISICLQALIAALVALIILSGCTDQSERKPPKPRYADLGLREVPANFRGTVMERCNLENTEPFAVSGYGLVVNLRDTGDNSNLPVPVREYMVKELSRHGFGTHRVPGFERRYPDDVLNDRRVAVVRVDGQVPAGARLDDTFDVVVSVPPESYTSSLAGGRLFQTDLRYMGADPLRPSGSVNSYGRAAGPVFVNPSYGLETPSATQTSARSSLRSGMVMDGGLSNFDNPLVLRVRQPQYSTARMVEMRINERFQNVADKQKKNGATGNAAAQDEGSVYVFLPKVYQGDWRHFSAVVMHLYLNGEPGFSAFQAKKLADEAVKPNAPLEDISYAWEGIGGNALPALLPLLSNPSRDVAYAAARAAAFIGDSSGSAVQALMDIAASQGNAYQINAVRDLGALPPSPMVAQMLRRLLENDSTLVRVEAYRILARQRDPMIYSKVINEKFVLDIVPGAGRPLIYATRQGIPRIALMGGKIALRAPVFFTAMDNRLSISSTETGNAVMLFYRGTTAKPIKQLSMPDMGEVIARLGGEGAPGEDRFDFTYADIVGLVQQLTDDKRITSGTDASKVTQFVLQEAPSAGDAISSAPRVEERSRPQEGPGDNQPLNVAPEIKVQ